MQNKDDLAKLITAECVSEKEWKPRSSNVEQSAIENIVTTIILNIKITGNIWSTYIR